MVEPEGPTSLAEKKSTSSHDADPEEVAKLPLGAQGAGEGEPAIDADLDGDGDLKGHSEMESKMDLPASLGLSKEISGQALTLDDPKRTLAIMRRLDIRVLPVAGLLYFFSFVDRTAIANSRVAGMNKDINLTDGQYRLAVSAFFMTYAFFEVPSNLCLRRIGAKYWLPATALPWGLMMIMSGIIHNHQGLLVCRLLLGVFEAGILPGITALISMIYPQSAIQLRIAMFFIAAKLGGAFGGLLAFGLSEIKAAGFAGWRWIFIVEGILTMLASIPAYFFLCNGIDDAPGITADDKAYMKDRILYDGHNGGLFEVKYKKKYVLAAFLDIKIWSVSIFFGLTALVSMAYALTLPVLLNTSFGYNNVKSQLMTVPVYLQAVIWVLTFAYISDKQGRRLLWYIIGTSISSVGWIVSYKSHNPKVRYAATYFAVGGVFASVPCAIALQSQNLAHNTKRATGLAIQMTISALVPIASSTIFPVTEAPQYLTGHRVCISSCFIAIVLAFAYRWVLIWENEKKRRMRESGEAAKLTREQLVDLGDKSPYFVYRF